MKKNKHTGGSFDDFLNEENIYEEVTSRALKKASIYDLERIVNAKRGLKSRIREALNNSPSMVDRLFSDNPKIEYDTLVRAGLSVGYAPIINWVPITDLKKN